MKVKIQDDKASRRKSFSMTELKERFRMIKASGKIQEDKDSGR